jgi:serine O-acetyltransferase
MNALKLIRSDIFRYTGNLSVHQILKAILTIEGVRYSIIFRIGSSLSRNNPIFYLFYGINRFLGRWYGFQIPLKTRIGHGLYIGHVGTFIVNGNVVIGNNCNFSPGVTIGQVSEGKKKGCPTIQDNVWIGTNSVCVGNITIGENTHICPNSFVNFDVPANSLIIGNPAVIKKDWKKTEYYIINKWYGDKV